MKRLITFLLLIALSLMFCVSVFADEDEPPPDPTKPPEAVRCSSALLYCFENSKTLYEKNVDDHVYPTSTVKIMTGIVAIEHFTALPDGLSTKITITDQMLASVVGNKMSPPLQSGETVTAEQMLYACLVGGANDAANVLAYAVSGSVGDFVTKMNALAGSSAIGVRSTKYTNPTGMHDDAMYTTAHDTAQIALYAMKNPDFARIVGTPMYVMEETDKSEYRNIYSRNAMISKYYTNGYYDSRAIGVNAGATAVGGYCTVEIMRDPDTGVKYMAVVMGADEDEETGEVWSYENAAALLNWGFACFNYLEVLSADKVVCELPVTLSSTVDYITLQPARSVMVFLPTNVNVERDVEVHYTTLYESLAAPVEAKTAVGTVTVMYNDEILGTVDLITTADVTRSEFLYVLAQIEDFVKSRFFIATAIAAVLLSLLYIFGQAFIRGRKANRL